MSLFFKVFKANKIIVLPVLLSISIIITTCSALIFIKKTKQTSGNANSSSNIITEIAPVQKNVPKSFKAISLTPEIDFLTTPVNQTTAINEAKVIIDEIITNRFNAINLTVNYKNGFIFDTDQQRSIIGDLLSYIYAYGKQNNLQIITTIDVGNMCEGKNISEADIVAICNVLSSKNLTSNSDMLIIKNCIFIDNNQFTSETISRNNAALKRFYMAATESNPALFVGFETGLTDFETVSVMEKSWLDGEYADFISIYNPLSTESTPVNFEQYLQNYINLFGTEKLFLKLAYEKLGTKEGNWAITDQIVQQLMKSDALGVNGVTIGSFASFANDKTESKKAVIKYLGSELSHEYVLKQLSITSPERKSFTTTDKSIILSGASDPEFSLTLNGKELERNELGYFSTDLNLNAGLNTFTIQHKGETQTYKITYTKTIIKDFYPTTTLSLPSESVLLLTCTALSKSTVTASLGKQSVKLTESQIVDSNGIINEEYSNYTGKITLPTVYENTVVGKVSFTAKSDFGTSTKQSGNITVEKLIMPDVSSSNSSSSNTSSAVSSNSPTSSTGSSNDGSSSNNSSADSSSAGSSSNSSSSGAPSGGNAWVFPTGGNYVNVGNSLIGEVIINQAETFNYNDTSDYSRPTNNYLPKGTVDYCGKPTSSSGGGLLTWRYGKMLYTLTSSAGANIKTYQGTLPDHNTLNVANVSDSGKYTEITLDVLWKAPFLFDLKPQKYTNEGINRDYTISSATYDHVDITFCYTTLITGTVDIPTDNPIFSKAEWIKNTSDFTLRLHLKKVGKFYGWNANYNEKGQLVFSFLNPAKITSSQNEYGYRLDGITVAIDVGHGGNDSGASGSNKNYPEAKLNLILAQKLKAQLESIGANVVMTRYDNNSNPTSYQRMETVRNAKANYAIAIHRNSSDSTSPRGFISYHFNAFTADAAKIIYNATESANLYDKSKWSGTKWHYFYTSRTTDCPVVLTENGFMTNEDEYTDMINDDFNTQCAKALTQGIVNYFVSIQ